MTLDYYRVSYAQNREDIIIESFFPDIDSGFYVDVGANDPEDDSVTKIFYDRGWSGINIEPNPSLHKKLSTVRNRDVNELVGIAAKTGNLHFREYQNHGLSTFSEDIMKEYELESNTKTNEYRDHKVKVIPLVEAIDRTKPTHIHFMKIDVEGFEYEVLASNDWKKYRPELICIEANHIKKDWHPILKNAEYILAFDDGLNEYYLSNESKHRLSNFDYATSIVLGKPIINAGLAKVLHQFEQVRSRILSVEQELQQTQLELAQTVNQRNSLFGQLQQYSNLRSQLKLLILNFRNLYRRRLELLTRPPKLKRSIHFTSDVHKEMSRGEINKLVLDYDKKAFRETRIINGRIRRLVYAVLNGIDLFTIKILKYVLRFIKNIVRLFIPAKRTTL